MGKPARFTWRVLFISVGLLSFFSYAEGADLNLGKKVYEGKRCGLCHTLEGKGGKIGPDLSVVGNTRDREWLMKFLKDPRGTVDGAKMMPVKASEEELLALTEYLLSLKK